MSASEVALRVLRPTAPLHPTAEPELDALSVDPLIFGNVQETFAKFIRNGEAVVFVRAADDQEAEFAADTLRQYDPITINVCPSPPNWNSVIQFQTEFEINQSYSERNRALEKIVIFAVIMIEGARYANPQHDCNR